MCGRREPDHVAFPRRSPRVLSGHRLRLDEVSAVDGPRTGGLAKDLAPGREPRPKERPSGSRPVASRPPLARPESAQSGRRPPRSLGPIAFQALLTVLDDARTAAERG